MKPYRTNFNFTKTITLVVLLILSLSATAEVLSSKKNFSSKYDTINVYINWESFEEYGLLDDYKTQVVALTEHALLRWANTTGFNLKLRYKGFTTKSFAGSGEIVIRAVDLLPYGGALAHYPGNQCTISYDANNYGVEWKLYSGAQDNSYDSYFTTLMHELAHCWGIVDNYEDYDSTDLTTVIGDYSSDWIRRYGPFKYDIETVRYHYDIKDKKDIVISRSTNDGVDWSVLNSNAGGLSNFDTTERIAAVREDDRMLAFFRHTKTLKPTYVSGSADAKDFTNYFTKFNYEMIYAPALGGWDDEYLVAWTKLSDHSLKVLRAGDGGESGSWAWKNPPDTYSAGSPGIAKLSKNTWILVYPNMDKSSSSKSGRVMVRVSTNDGNNWGPAMSLDNLKAIDGVAVAAKNESDIRISFHQASNNPDELLRLVTVYGYVDDGEFFIDNTQFLSAAAHSSLVPISMTNSSNGFHLGFLSQIKEVRSMSGDLGSESWRNSKKVESNSGPFVSPGIVARKGASYIYMFYPEE